MAGWIAVLCTVHHGQQKIVKVTMFEARTGKLAPWMNGTIPSTPSSKSWLPKPMASYLTMLANLSRGSYFKIEYLFKEKMLQLKENIWYVQFIFFSLFFKIKLISQKVIKISKNVIQCWFKRQDVIFGPLKIKCLKVSIKMSFRS